MARPQHGGPPSWKKAAGLWGVNLTFCRFAGLVGLIWVLVINLYLRQQRAGVASDFEPASPSRLVQAKAAMARRWQYRKYPSVAVVIMPSPVHDPGTRAGRIQAIMRTWGSQHREKVEIVIATGDRSLDARHHPDDMVLEFPQHLDDNNNLGRLQWLLRQLYHRKGSVEWVMLANDHTYVVPDNLLCYLANVTHTHGASTPLYLGHRLQVHGVTFNSGGAGALLNHAAIKVLLGMWDDAKDPDCTARDDWARLNAGVVIAKCLQKAGVVARDTRDEKGGERFHVYGPVRTVDGQVDDWFRQYHDYKCPSGPACCAADSISFHYVGPTEALVLYDVTTRPGKYRAINKEQQFASWPTEPLVLGGYSYPPNNKTSQVFEFLLDKFRLCPI